MRTVLWRASRVKLFVFVLAAVWAVTSTLGGTQDTTADYHTGDATRSTVVCHPTKAGHLPGAVIIDGVRATDPVVIGKALDQELDGIEAGLTVNAFCA